MGDSISILVLVGLFPYYWLIAYIAIGNILLYKKYPSFLSILTLWSLHAILAIITKLILSRIWLWRNRATDMCWLMGVDRWNDISTILELEIMEPVVELRFCDINDFNKLAEIFLKKK